MLRSRLILMFGGLAAFLAQAAPAPAPAPAPTRRFLDEDEFEEDQLTNKLIDNMLEDLKKQDNLEPYHLHQDYEMDLHETFQLIPWDMCMKKCKLTLHNGTVWGMKNINRYGNGEMDNDGDDLIVRVRLEATNMTIEGNMSVNVVGFQLSNAPVRNRVAYQVQYMEIAIGDATDIRLRELRIERVEGLTMELIDGSSESATLRKKFHDYISSKMIKLMDKQLEEIATRIMFPILAGEFRYMGRQRSAR